jgi:hypothetical protein
MTDEYLLRHIGELAVSGVIRFDENRQRGLLRLCAKPHVASCRKGRVR